MRLRVALLCLMFILLAVVVSGAAQPEATTAQPAANTILLIGDGMGPEVIELAKDYASVIEKRQLWIEKVISEGNLALVHTPPLGKLVTDSAAAATALATGQKTVNEAVSVTPQGKALPTILEMARNRLRSTGIVTTTRLTHATPACFAAHGVDRDSESNLAEQMLEAGVDVMMGGGMQYWIPGGEVPPETVRLSAAAGAGAKSEREDNINLLGRAAEAGYKLVSNQNELLGAGKADRLLGLFAASHLPYALDRRLDDAANVPSLAEMTEKAIEILSKNKGGFFLMVEGGRIDHAAHNNDAAAMIADMIDFDAAVGVAYAFAKKDPRTVIFITADHATGAPCLSARYSDEAGQTIYPDAEFLRKIYRQDASFEFIMSELAKKPTAEELKRLVSNHIGVQLSDKEAAFVMKAEPISPFHVTKPKYRKIGYPTFALARLLGTQYGIAWATAEHYAAPAVLVGYGAHADLVHGYVENTDVFKIMKTAGGL